MLAKSGQIIVVTHNTAAGTLKWYFSETAVLWQSKQFKSLWIQQNR